MRPWIIRPSDNHLPRCPLCDSLENYRLAPGAEREDPCFFKMLLVFFLYFCLSFVILMDNLTTKSPVTRKEIAWKAKTITEKQPFEFSTYHGLCPIPLSLLQAYILDLSSPGISRTSWIFRIFNKFFVFESFCRTVCETLPILGFASSTLYYKIAILYWIFFWLFVHILALDGPCPFEWGWWCRVWRGQCGGGRGSQPTPHQSLEGKG